MVFSHLFGPVNSRRLKRSLGVDLVPYKVCSFDCVYCEVGSTTQKTTVRQEFFPPSEVEEEISAFLSAAPDLDFVTMSGSGEPTLCLSLGRILRFVKSSFPQYRLAVLTNGSLLWDRGVQRDLLPADVVLPTLSTVDESTFQRIHRPSPDLSIATIIRGLSEFRAVYEGEIWLEIFLVPGINMDHDGLAALGREIERICPERVQFNTLDRPGTESWVRPASHAEIEAAARILGVAGAEPISSISYGSSHGRMADDAASMIVRLIQRRPCTIEDLIQSTGLHRQEVGKMLRGLSSDPRLHSRREARGIFYSWTDV